MTRYQMFARRLNGPNGPRFEHVFPTQGQVRMCGDHDVVAVSVRLAGDEEEPSHWGWVDTGKDQPTMIWPSYFQLCVCFQGEGAMLDQQKRGRGNPVRLIVEPAP